jgi:hypothetical protein
MRSRRMLTIVALAALLLTASACKQKRKPPLPPMQASAPTITQPQPTNPGPPPPITAEPSRPLPTPGEAVESADLEKPAPKPRRPIVRRTIAPPPEAEAPKKTVVQNGGDNPASQVTASVSHGDSLQQRLDTVQLINTAENTLKSMPQKLSDGEQALVQHIRSFITQSQNATKDGDLDRAYLLALKARQLADELVKR